MKQSVNYTAAGIHELRLKNNSMSDEDKVDLLDQNFISHAAYSQTISRLQNSQGHQNMFRRNSMV
jgi:hypothetical protein